MPPSQTPSPASTPRPLPIPLPPALRSAWAVLLLCALGSLLFCLVRKLVWNLGLRQSFPLSSDADLFGDFTIYWHLFDRLHTPAFFHAAFPFTYPAPVALVYDLFLHHLGPHPLIAFITFLALSFLVPAALFTRALSRRGLRPLTALALGVLLLAFSWPATIVIDRANMEVLVWISLALAIWSFCTGRLSAAAVLFGVAAAFKLFPFVYLGLFLSTRDWRRLFLGIASFVGLTLASLAFVGPTIASANHGIQQGILFFRTNYMATWHPLESGVDHSLFNLYKTVVVKLTHAARPGHAAVDFSRSLSLYLLLSAVVGILLYVLRIRRLPLLNQILCFSICSILFTAFSGDGTLLHLYYPFALLVFLALAAARQGAPGPSGLRPALVLLAALVSPLSFAFLAHLRVEGPLHCLLLVALLLLALRLPFGPSLQSSRASSRTLLQQLDARA